MKLSNRPLHSINRVKKDTSHIYVLSNHRFHTWYANIQVKAFAHMQNTTPFSLSNWVDFFFLKMNLINYHLQITYNWNVVEKWHSSPKNQQLTWRSIIKCTILLLYKGKKKGHAAYALTQKPILQLKNNSTSLVLSYSNHETATHQKLLNPINSYEKHS